MKSLDILGLSQGPPSSLPLEASNASGPIVSSDLPSSLEDASSLLSFVFFYAKILVIPTIFLAYWLRNDSKEPPTVGSPIPFLGNWISLAIHRVMYFLNLSSKSRLPIFTMRFPTSTYYIVNAPNLVSQVQRNAKTLSFYPFMSTWLAPLVGFNKSDVKTLETNMMEPGTNSYVTEADHVHHNLLSKGGASFNKLVDQTLEIMAAHVNAGGLDAPERKGLVDWTWRAVSEFSMQAIWGPQNPFKTTPGLEKDLWNVNDSFHLLLLNILPSALAPRASRSRENVVSAFEKFYKSYFSTEKQSALTDDSISSLFHERARLSQKYNFTHEGAARLELGHAQALVTNTVPAIMWLLLRICSEPSLLRSIRAELASSGVVAVDETSKTAHVDFKLIEKACPLLVSTWKEVLRTSSHLPTGRTVIADTPLKVGEREYTLKKDASVLVFSGVLHSDPAIWGSDADTFNARRFMPASGASTSEERKRKQAQAVAFRPFGGGTILCPGRHYAFATVMSFVSVVLSGFEVELTGKGKDLGLEDLKMDAGKPSLGLWFPEEAKNMGIRIVRRTGWEDVHFQFGQC